MSDKILLSICMPSYNRGERVKANVSYLLASALAAEGKVEIVVSNNASTDDTAELIAPFTSVQNFYLHNRVEHLPTAEEHMFAAYHLCRGQYIWFLGDDDIPNLETFKFLLETLQSNSHDFLFFNSHFADGNAGHLGHSLLRLNAESVEGEFSELAPRLGFVSSFAGLSTLVCRRELLTDDMWEEAANISLIYSHVVWWYKCFQGRKIIVVNRPLVTYRVDESSSTGALFSRLARRLSLNDLYFWGEGLVRLLMFMEKDGALSMEQVRFLWEARRDGTVYRLLDNIVNTLFHQVKLGILSEEKRNRNLPEGINSSLEWVLRADPGYFECVRLIRLAFDAAQIPANEDAKDRIEWVEHDFGLLLEHKMAKSNRYLDFQQSYRGYDIYAHRVGAVAFHADSKIDRQLLLREIDPEAIGLEVLIGEGPASIRSRIDDAISHKVMQQKGGRA